VRALRTDNLSISGLTEISQPWPAVWITRKETGKRTLIIFQLTKFHVSYKSVCHIWDMWRTKQPIAHLVDVTLVLKVLLSIFRLAGSLLNIKSVSKATMMYSARIAVCFYIANTRICVCMATFEYRHDLAQCRKKFILVFSLQVNHVDKLQSKVCYNTSHQVPNVLCFIHFNVTLIKKIIHKLSITQYKFLNLNIQHISEKKRPSSGIND